MAETPTTWHHGLVARWWAEFNVDGPEIDYFRRHVERGQPALDVACGTGRLLIPYLRDGLDVDGCDVSADMIELCGVRAAREAVSPTLLVQPMHELDPPRRYRTIYVCGGFGLGSTRDQDAQALRRFHECLEPGGTLVLDNENPYAGGSPWRYWQAEGRTGIPREWEPLEEAERRRAADGSEIALQSRVIEFDPLEQCTTYEMRAGLWRDGELVQREEHALRLNLYFMHEVLLLLERAGFADILVHGDYVEEPPGPETRFVAFVARRAA
jgi:SAM-dependent methyltransferase